MALTRTERQLILLSAATAERRSARREQAHQLMRVLDWSRFAETLRLRTLLPVLGPRVLELAEGRADASFAAEVEHALEAGRRQGAFLQLTSMRVMAMLAEAGIRSAPLKGPMLSEAIYGDPGRRLSGDVDLLVAPEQLRSAVDVVRALGYEEPTDLLEEGGLPRLHFALSHERGELPPVELHWRIHWYERDFARERLLPPTAAEAGAWRPVPVDELAALLLFYARDGFIDLRLATDLSAWWDVNGAQLRLGALDELLRSYPALSHVIPVSLRTAERVVGLPAARILELPSLRLRDRMAVRLANPNPRSSQAQLYADKGLVDGLLAPPGDLRAFIRRQVLLPPDVLEELDRRAPKRHARSSVGRAAGILARYGLTMVRMVRSAETVR